MKFKRIWLAVLMSLGLLAQVSLSADHIHLSDADDAECVVCQLSAGDDQLVSTTLTVPVESSRQGNASKSYTYASNTQNASNARAPPQN